MTDFAAFPELLDAIGEYSTISGGLTYRCPLPARHRNGDANPSARLLLSDEGDAVALCLGCGAKRAEIAKALDLPVPFFLNPRKRRGNNVTTTTDPPKPVAHYFYRDANGRHIATKTRYEPGHGGRRKSFQWSRIVTPEMLAQAELPPGTVAVIEGHDALGVGHFAPNKWGDGSYHFRKTQPTVDGELPPHSISVDVSPVIPLYQSDKLAKLREGATVLLVEGEKDVESCNLLGIPATCTPLGTMLWDPSFSTVLSRLSVIVVPDNDGPGLTHATIALGSLIVAGARAVRLLAPGRGGYEPPADGGDITDWMKAKFQSELLLKQHGAIKTALIDLCKDLPRYDRVDRAIHSTTPQTEATR